MKKHVVCLDPGHGPGTVNGSPDGTYKEQEFAWDMYQHIAPLLEAQGIEVVLTRGKHTKPSLSERAAVSNKANADLFVSLHSNAAGSSGWSSASGLLIYTSQGGDAAQRNVAAKAILHRMEEAHVSLHGSGLAHNGYTVLTKTAAPAILIEFGFHTHRGDVAKLTNPAYRDKLALATAKGIGDFLGVGGDVSLDTAPWYAGDQAWVQKMGISDGLRPEEPITRAEVWAMLQGYDLARAEGRKEM